MAVVFRGPDQIEIDGVSAGGIEDVIKNHPSRLPEVLTAFGVLLSPWNKRWIDAEKFVERFTPKQARAVYTSTDVTLVGARQLLDSYIEANDQVILDDPQVTGLTAYMVAVGLLTQQERDNVLRDSNSFERFTGINIMPEPEPDLAGGE